MIWPEDRHLHRKGPVEEREFQCPACGLAWYADGREEYGWWEPTNEDDAYCGRCGCEGERPLPESLARHLRAFVAMRRIATINRRLALAYPASGPARRAEHERFLTDAANWFERFDLG